MYPTHTRFFEDAFGKEASVSIERCAIVDRDNGPMVQGYSIVLGGQDTKPFKFVLDDKEFAVMRRALIRYPFK